MTTAFGQAYVDPPFNPVFTVVAAIVVLGWDFVPGRTPASFRRVDQMALEEKRQDRGNSGNANSERRAPRLSDAGELSPWILRPCRTPREKGIFQSSTSNLAQSGDALIHPGDEGHFRHVTTIPSSALSLNCPGLLRIIGAAGIDRSGYQTPHRVPDGLRSSWVLIAGHRCMRFNTVAGGAQGWRPARPSHAAVVTGQKLSGAHAAEACRWKWPIWRKS